MRLLITLLSLVLLLGVVSADVAVTDVERFAAEYEALNGKKNLDGSQTYQALSVPADASIVYVDEAAIYELLIGGTGVLYLGFPECPWCRTLLPALFEAAAGETILYYNALDERTKLSLAEDGSITVDKAGSDLYDCLLETLDPYLDPYDGLNDEAIKRIYFPTTVFVKDGEVVKVHLYTVDSHENGYDPLTDEQYAELLASLKDGFAKLY